MIEVKEGLFNEVQICSDAIDFFGTENQLAKALEEVEELRDELENIKCKLDTQEPLTKNDLIGLSEEMADVDIMTTQLCLIFGNAQLLENYKQLKLHKLNQMIERNEW